MCFPRTSPPTLGTTTTHTQSPAPTSPMWAPPIRVRACRAGGALCAGCLALARAQVTDAPSERALTGRAPRAPSLAQFRGRKRGRTSACWCWTTGGWCPLNFPATAMQRKSRGRERGGRAALSLLLSHSRRMACSVWPRRRCSMCSLDSMHRPPSLSLALSLSIHHAPKPATPHICVARGDGRRRWKLVEEIPLDVGRRFINLPATRSVEEGRAALAQGELRSGDNVR